MFLLGPCLLLNDQGHFFAGLLLFLLEFCLFEVETALHLEHLSFSLFQFVKTHVQMQLLVLKRLLLLLVQLHEVLDEIEEIPRSDVVELLGGFGQFFVELNHSAVHSHDGIDEDGVPRLVLLHRRVKRFRNRVDHESEFLGHLVKTLF